MRSAPIIIGIVVSALCVSFSWAQEQTPKDDKQKLNGSLFTENRGDSREKPKMQKTEKSLTKTISLPVYKPPKRGAPGGRVGGATRGDQEAYLTVEVLAPEKVRGLTSQEQPDLYWYISKPTNWPVEFTVIDEDRVAPLVETRLPAPSRDGIQKVRLSDFGIYLTEDKMYRWSIALVLDPESRSKDILAGARIQRALASEIPSQKLTGADPLHATFIHAEAGLWYDAMASISHAIQSDPEYSQYYDVRAALLEQVGLDVIARAERKRMAAF